MKGKQLVEMKINVIHRNESGFPAEICLSMSVPAYAFIGVYPSTIQVLFVLSSLLESISAIYISKQTIVL